MHNAVEQQFEEFFMCFSHGQDLESSVELRAICEPLYKLQRRRQAQRFLVIAASALIAYLLLTQSDLVAWILSAIGRLLLIQLLPYWNWTSLYNAKCLIQQPKADATTKPRPPLGKYETDAGNCVLCENLDHVATLANTNFSYIESNFLESGRPVIITDSHAPLKVEPFLVAMEATGTRFVDSQPCDIATNLMLRKLFNLNLAVQKMKTPSSADSWFLQFRNCDFDAVKSSRLFLQRPYYYPMHLKPFYSSWILMAHNYSKRFEQLYMHGLIVMQQLHGSFDIELRPKQPCASSCPTVSINLRAGESLVFSTDLWTFSYGLKRNQQEEANALATIMEIDWSL